MSSPHTRGSSVEVGVVLAWHRVVPAHAGVIPAPAGHRAASSRRPRTRGGHPPLIKRIPAGFGSSPHTRGSSGHAVGLVGPGRVVPAHAGVILHRGQPCPVPGRRPRTRGGHPRRNSPFASCRMSSPHTRGSSACCLTAGPRRRVVPAHAGVIPRARCCAAACSCRPRTRGGHPTPWVDFAPGDRSSPHTRGSSSIALRKQPPQAVVPAHAGVIPRRRRLRRVVTCRPRTRGGHPIVTADAGIAPLSSPHTRGSSPPGLRLPLDRPVVPAHAGVIRSSTSTVCPGIGRPRTRGGHPRSRSNSVTMALSSPHTRGSSRGARGLRGSHPVVPAHAGVIPPTPARWRCWPGRPRTRGGHPSPTTAPSARRASSPHTRGSSPTPRHLGVDPPSSPHTRGSSLRHALRRHRWRVVRAHAGVIRRPAATSWSTCCRPRTRGGHPDSGLCTVCGGRSSPHTRGSSGVLL